MKKILISTGGSGGHVLPALNIYDHLHNNFDISIITDKRGSRFIDNKLYKFDIIDTPRLSLNIFTLFVNIYFFFYSLVKAFIYFKKNKIKVLVSTGGYMSFPFCLTAIIMNVKIILFEPNMVLGRSNKIILKFAKKIICYDILNIKFPKKYSHKIFAVEPLLKKEIYKLQKYKQKKNFGNLDLLIIGGSQGAEFFDDFIKNVLTKLSDITQIKVYQQINNQKKQKILSKTYEGLGIKYSFFSFDTNILSKIGNIDLAITRCGASSLAELTHLNIPFIGVPFPFAKDNHQYMNGKFYYDKGCCWLIDQKEIDTQKVETIIKNIINNNSNFGEKILNMNKLSIKNNWRNTNTNLIKLFDEC